MVGYMLIIEYHFVICKNIIRMIYRCCLLNKQKGRMLVLFYLINLLKNLSTTCYKKKKKRINMNVMIFYINKKSITTLLVLYKN